MKLHRALARLAGYDLLRRSKDHLRIENHLRTLLERTGVDVVLDVGANRGQFALSLRTLGYRGRIHSFEPVQSTFDALKLQAAPDPLWTVHRLALGNASESRSIHVARGSDLASFLDANDQSRRLLGERAAIERVEVVPVARLDALWPSLVEGIPAPRVFLKIDTQGHELEVWRGAGARTREVLLLQSEVALVPIYDGAPDWLEFLDGCRRAGFEPTGFFPVSRDRGDLRIVELDCVMLNRALRVELGGPSR